MRSTIFLCLGDRQSNSLSASARAFAPRYQVALGNAVTAKLHFGVRSADEAQAGEPVLTMRRLLPRCIGSDVLRKAFAAEEAHGGNEAVEVGDLPVTEDWTAEIGADLHDVVRIASDETVRLCSATELTINVEEQLATGIENSGEMRPCSGDRLFRRDAGAGVIGGDRENGVPIGEVQRVTPRPATASEDDAVGFVAIHNGFHTPRASGWIERSGVWDLDITLPIELPPFPSVGAGDDWNVVRRAVIVVSG